MWCITQRGAVWNDYKYEIEHSTLDLNDMKRWYLQKRKESFRGNRDEKMALPAIANPCQTRFTGGGFSLATQPMCFVCDTQRGAVCLLKCHEMTSLQALTPRRRAGPASKRKHASSASYNDVSRGASDTCAA